VPKHLAFFNNLLPNDHHWFVGSRISLADISLFATLDLLEKSEVQKHLGSFPKLLENHERVRRQLHN